VGHYSRLGGQKLEQGLSPLCESDVTRYLCDGGLMPLQLRSSLGLKVESQKVSMEAYMEGRRQLRFSEQCLYGMDHAIYGFGNRSFTMRLIDRTERMLMQR
jgi:hypothetical protein